MRGLRYFLAYSQLVVESVFYGLGVIGALAMLAIILAYFNNPELHSKANYVYYIFGIFFTIHLIFNLFTKKKFIKEAIDGEGYLLGGSTDQGESYQSADQNSTKTS